MKHSIIAARSLVLLLFAGACGGSEGGPAGDGDGDGMGDGDAAGGTQSGDGDGDAGGDGGSVSGGATSTGGSASTGGEQSGSGGLPAICQCDAMSIPVCGVDGTTYDAGCGDECVPVEIECQGMCPCSGCDCQVIDGNACPVGERQWLCAGSGYSPAAFEAEGCETLPVGSIRYCCANDVVPEDFCQD